jgi:uncharacterized membrane protein
MAMIWLILGLVVFLGVHSLRLLAPDWREARVAAMGKGAWMGVFSAVSIAGFVLIVWGYGQARLDPVLVWVPPLSLRHASALLTLPAFILLAATYVPRNHLKARLGHPMLLGTKLWALAHLLVNGWLHGMVLFASFLIWAILSFRAARKREPASRAGGTLLGTTLAVVIGTAAWAGFAFYLHEAWIGVAPFG